MARPSKLTDKQWAEVEKRVPPLGTESMRSVAKELGISEGVIRKRVKTHTKPVNALANQLASAELALERLPLSTQVKVRTLADRLKGISENLAEAAELGSNTASMLHAIANSRVNTIDRTKPLDEDGERSIKAAMAIVTTANAAAQTGLTLLSTNKGKESELPKNLNELSDDELYAIATGSGG